MAPAIQRSPSGARVRPGRARRRLPRSAGSWMPGCWRASRRPTGAPRWSGSCRPMRSSWCCAARSRAGRASGRPAVAGARLRKPPAPPGTRRRDGLEEAAALWWREEVGEGTLRRDGRRWTAWTVWLVVVFTAPGVGLLLLSPWTLPVALGCFAHAWIVPWLQARRGARSVVPLGSDRSVARTAGGDPAAEGVALGLLGDLVGHRERELLRRCGLVIHSGALGVWLVGERGALMVRPGGRRVDCWCVRVADSRDRVGTG